jgi:hypothetical protein
MRQGSLLLVLSLICVAESASAFDTGCIRTKFVEYLGRATHAVGVPYFDPPTKIANKFTIVTKLKGPRSGQQLLIRKKKDASWDDGFRSDMNANFNLFGDKLSAFLGFKRVSENEILVPDADEWNRGIEALNALIKDPKQKISTRFYTPKSDRVPPREYWEEYIYRNRLPIANRGSETVHDIGIHGAGSFLPEVMLVHMKRHHQALDEFERFAIRNYPKTDPMGLEKLKSKFKSVVEGINTKGDSAEGLAQQVDYFTAIPGLSGSKLELSLNGYLPPSLARNHSPETFLQEQFNWGQSVEVRKILEKFIESKKSDPHFKEKYRYNYEENKKLIWDRLKYIKSLVETNP